MPTPDRPGAYIYRDPLTPPLRVKVVQDGDQLCAVFQDAEEGDCLVPVTDLAGDFVPLVERAGSREQAT